MKKTGGHSEVHPSHKLGISESDAVIDSLPLGIVFQDKEGKIITANPAAERILGLSLDQMQGVTSTDPRWQAVREDGSPFPGEDHPAMVSLRTGLPVKNVKMGVFNPAIEDFSWIDVCAFPAKDEAADAAGGVYTIFEDITALKKAERSLKSTEVKLESTLASVRESRTEQEALASLAVRNRALHQAVSDGIHVLDEQGHLVEVNDAFCRMLGYSEEEILRLNIADIDEQWLKEELHAKLIELVRGHKDLPVTFETRHRSKDGTIREVDINGISVILDGHNYFYASARDITDRKQAERAMKIAKEAAESLARAKSDFLAMMTHELRTPLNGVMGFSELLSDTQLNNEQREYVLSISSSGSYLLGIINDILDYSTIEHGKLEIDGAPFSIAEILESSMGSVRKSRANALKSEEGKEVRVIP